MVPIRQVVIVGGGAAGLAAAVELSRRGLASTIVERSPNLGGRSLELACKGSPACVRCDACYPYDLRREASRSDRVRVMLGAEIEEVFWTPSGADVKVSTPEGSTMLTAGAVILATGSTPFDPGSDPRLHSQECPDVLSSLDVERRLAAWNRLTVPSTGRPPQEVAIVQCVGSRDVKRGVPYCSKACCKYAYKLGLRLRHLHPDLKLTFFFMDWRPLEDAGKALEAWAAADGQVRLVRSRPAEVIPGERPALRYAAPGESIEEESFDIVMLSVGMVPLSGNSRLAELFGIELDALGHLRSHRERVLIAGTSGGPKDIRESVEEGTAAAGMAARLLEAES